MASRLLRLGQVALIVFCLGKEFALSQWEWRNPLPQGKLLADLQAFSLTKCIVVGERGTFLTTASAGKSWNLTTLQGLPDITYLQFFDQATGIVIGSQDSVSRLLRTTDAGNQWSEIHPAPGMVRSAAFLNTDTGWVATDSALVFTASGGLSWVSRALPGNRVSRLFFLDKLTGWAISWDTVYRTTDGGTSWRGVRPDSGLATIMNKVQFINSQVGWVIGTSRGPNHFSGHVYKSTDGGIDWFEQLTVGEDFVDYRTFSDIDMSDEHLGWVVAQGRLYKTEDGGKTWNEIAAVPYLYQVSSVNNLQLWGCGPDGALYYSGDGGVIWAPKYQGTIIGLDDLYWLDENTGFAAGDTLLLKTRDQGVTWEPVPVVAPGQNDFVVRSVWFVDSLRGWLGVEHAGGLGGLFSTTDGGHSWVTELDSVYRISSLFFIGKTHGWAASGPRVYHTSDGGITWAAGGASTDPGQIESLYFVSPDSGWAGGYLGMAQTTDGGISWATASPAGLVGLYAKGIHFISPLVGWVVGYSGNDGFIFRTDDGGKNWRSQAHPSLPWYTWPLGVTFVDENHGLVGGQSFSGGFAFRTTDGGAHWEVDDIPFNRALLRSKSQGEDIWVLGSDGAILRRSLNSTNIREEDVTRLPSTIKLAQNHPNPFNPSTAIKYTVGGVGGQGSGIGNVKLIVYDLLGREVAVLVNERKSPGSYEVSFDGSGLPSGVYICRLIAGSYVQSRKMMLLR
jgi:photosystem II stability/assembly factor-like uncharacterized protein